MKILILFLLWCLLLVFSWPLAVAALIVLPLVWLMSLPFRLVFIVVEGILGLIKAIVFLPARLFGTKSKA